MKSFSLKYHPPSRYRRRRLYGSLVNQVESFTKETIDLAMLKYGSWLNFNKLKNFLVALNYDCKFVNNQS